MRSQSPSARRLSSEYWPTGTVFGLPITMRFTRGSRRSPGLLISSRESPGLMTVSTFRANARRVEDTMSAAFSSSSIWRWAAETKRSTGAPASICFWSSPEAPKLKRNTTPGRPELKPRASSSTASFMLTATESTSSSAAAGAGVSRRASKRRVTRLIGATVYRTARSGAAALLNPGQRPVHQEHQEQQDERERYGRVEISLARLEHRRRREHAGVALDIAADHKRGAHLGDHRAKAGHDSRQHGQAGFLQECPDHLRSRSAQGQDLETELLRHLLDGGQREPGDDGRGDDELSQDHGGGGVEQLEHAQHAAAPEDDGDEEADHDGRQPHAGIDQADHEAATRETRQRERRAERDAGDEREEGRRRRDAERQPRDLPDLRVPTHEEPKRLEKALADQLHSLLEIGVGLAGDGDEERLAVLVPADVLDPRLRLRRHHEIGQGLAARGVDARAIGRVDLHHRIDVEQRLVLLDQDRQADALLEREPGATVGDRVGASIVRDAERLPHALPRLDVPGPLGLNPRLLPKAQLEQVRA